MGFAIMLADNKLGILPREEQIPMVSTLGHLPMLMSYKLDGIRAIVHEGVVKSRKLIPIRSKFVQQAFGHLEGLDGELIAGDATSPTCYRDTYAAVMTIDAMEPVTFKAFDLWTCDQPYSCRYRKLQAEMCVAGRDRVPHVEILTQTMVHDIAEIEAGEAVAIESNYEGLILRRPDSPYKFGRSTLNQGYMIKLKRHLDSEAKIVGFEELMHNANEDVRDNLGYAKRSSALAGLVGMNTLGAIIAEDEKMFPGIQFRIGVFKGFNKSELQAIWNARDDYLGHYMRYHYVLYGAKDRPRHPRGYAFRDSMDM